MTAEKVHAGIAVAIPQFAERGWEADVGMIRPDDTAGPAVEQQLSSKRYDCVVVGGGVRLPPRNLRLFEVVVNAIRKTAPGTATAFNTRPDDSADAAARCLPAASQSVLNRVHAAELPVPALKKRWAEKKAAKKSQRFQISATTQPIPAEYSRTDLIRLRHPQAGHMCSSLRWIGLPLLFGRRRYGNPGRL